MPLITITEIRAKRQVSNNVTDILIEPHIEDAEYVDLMPLLGNQFYQDIVTNPSSTVNGSYPNLLNGSTYQWNEKTYSHPGIKSVLIDFAVARYKLYGSNIDTPFGYVNKQSESSNQIQFDQRRAEYAALRKTAEFKWEQVRLFLSRVDSYKLWEGTSEYPIDDDRAFIVNKLTLE
jgi:hypothetical protein